MACETQTYAQFRLVITMIQTQMKGKTQIRIPIHRVVVRQPKLDEKGNIHMRGNITYKVRSTNLSSKRASRSYYWMVWPIRLCLIMYNVYANVDLPSFGPHFFFSHHHFFCSHGLHVPRNLCSTTFIKVGMTAHHDAFRRPMRIQIIEGWIQMGCRLESRLPCTSMQGKEMLW